MRRWVYMLLALAVTSCGPPTPDSFKLYGYWWQPDPHAVPCPPNVTVDWIQLPQSSVDAYCIVPGRPACSLRTSCTVISVYNEAQARTVFAFGESTYDHEMRHLHGTPDRPQRLQHPAGFDQ